ncbi:uncharacterized protein H6S33_011449 [Morchella sextelata]|uniref:uncharacterized protein n=1 Tax=Morchella sextelata TaxID=1174677 RepID=UPI001D050658|nr:uncharacterized protein H6S33_011449 [Morchella sextelata]KAH0611022.1 hypothetical protein H6S33_011449 [Morchella sextelata]
MCLTFGFTLWPTLTINCTLYLMRTDRNRPISIFNTISRAVAVQTFVSPLEEIAGGLVVVWLFNPGIRPKTPNRSTPFNQHHLHAIRTPPALRRRDRTMPMASRWIVRKIDSVDTDASRNTIPGPTHKASRSLSPRRRCRRTH